MSRIPIVDPTLNEAFSAVLLSTFPATAKDFVDSDAQKALEILRTYYLGLSPADEDNKTSELYGLHHEPHQIEQTLTNLSKSTLSPTSYGSPELRSPTSPSVDGGGNKPSPVKKNRKRSRGASVVFGDSASRDIGASMSHGLEEANSLEADLLQERKRMLNVSIADRHLLFHC